MLSRGDAVVYKCRGLYKVEDIGTLDFSFVDNSKQYYTLQSVENAGDKAYVPAEDETNIRCPVSRDEALALIRRMPDIEELQARLPVGSSARITGASLASARAIATRCC